MNLRTNGLRDAIVLALLIGASQGVAAQEQSSAEDKTSKTLDTITVTGSRIRQVDVETAQPVTFITREDIDKQGFQSVADILQNITATGTPPISRASPLSAGENAGGTFISLRNLGAARTLVLLNGRRLGISTSGLADISKIPASAVERIEVLKDGASSLYGSDAIGGVINVITRSNYEGAMASAYVGQFDEGDGEITKLDGVFGVTGERGSITLAAELRDEKVVRAADRPYSAFPRSNLHPTDNWTTVGQFGGFVTTATTPVPGVATGTRVVLRDGADPRLASSYRAQDTVTGSCAGNSLASPGPGVCVPGNIADKTNTNLQTDLRTPVKGKSLYIDGNYELTDDLLFRANFMYNNRFSSRTVAGYPMQAASFNTPMAATSYFNPTGATISNWWRRTFEVPRVSDGDATDYRFVAALESSFEIGERIFDWDLSYLWNQSKQVQSTYGNLNLANTRNAVGPSFLDGQAGLTFGQVVCGTPDNPATTTVNERNVIAGCVPFNPFLPMGRVGPGGLTDNQALKDYLFQEEHATGETETRVFSANITGGLFDLPAGELAFAAGLEYRKEEGKFVPDALAVTGGSTNLSSGPTRGSYNVKEAYVELQAPLLMDKPFAKELSLNVASRYSDYDTFGDTTNSKISLKWKPFDSLLVRATAADGFRAPTISDLYGGTSQTFSFFTDPCDTLFGSASNNATTRNNCINGVGGNGALGAQGATYRQRSQTGLATAVNTQTPIAFTQGNNPALIPEQSKSQTIGFVWSPTFATGLNFSLDWWKIRITDSIVTDSPNNMLNDCYILGIAERCVAPAGAVPGFTRAADGTPFVSFSQINAGFRKVEGFDIDASYQWKTARWGDFSVTSNSTYTAKDYLVTSNTPQIPLSSVGNTSTFRIRSNLNLGWQLGDFGASWMVRYYSSMKEGCTYFTTTSAANLAAGVQPVTEPHLECQEIVMAPSGAINADGSPRSALSRRRIVGATAFNDVQVRWQAPWNATIAVGANNVFEKVGPVMYSQPSANVSYYGGFDVGRFLYMKYTQKF